MNAKKCDKCGKFYFETEENVTQQAVRVLLDALRMTADSRLLFGKLRCSADLCSECETSLRAWCAGGNNDE